MSSVPPPPPSTKPEIAAAEPLIVEPPKPRLYAGRGKGYIPNRDRKDFKIEGNTARHLLGAPLGVPAEFSLESFIRAIYDQGQTSSCVGWAFAQAIMLRLAFMGAPISLPSPVAIYTYARAMMRASTSTKLVDQGSIPSYAVDGMNKFGVPSNIAWPFAESTINDEPNLEEMEAASAFRLTGVYHITSTGSQRIADFKQAISSGYPVVIGTGVDQAFEDYNGKGVITAPNPSNILGGHMMHIVGYTPDGRWRGVNQWGTGWGDLGLYWADDAFITSDEMSDAFALTAIATGHTGDFWQRKAA